MIITIDTKTDSKQDIQKAIDLLKSLLQQSESYSSYQTPQADTTPMMDMFNTSPQESSQTRTSSGTPPDFSAFLNLGKDEKKPASGKIQLY